ncbi:hypothetical protein NDU88_001310 [Pleurodeles waltl]|uniref:Uncharacterized protein n=1 Tax=Pleurodeles waltl TaxID=8319 RepID=A0AAV7P6F3_PLEWA|nr:hypothetical protein NDU88_001310 [Pleurodeles waltl]
MGKIEKINSGKGRGQCAERNRAEGGTVTATTDRETRAVVTGARRPWHEKHGLSRQEPGDRGTRITVCRNRSEGTGTFRYPKERGGTKFASVRPWPT